MHSSNTDIQILKCVYQTRLCSFKVSNSTRNMKKNIWQGINANKSYTSLFSLSSSKYEMMETLFTGNEARVHGYDQSSNYFHII